MTSAVVVIVALCFVHCEYMIWCKVIILILLLFYSQLFYSFCSLFKLYYELNCLFIFMFDLFTGYNCV